MKIKALQLVTNMVLINTCFYQDNCNQCIYTSGNRCDLTNKLAIINKIRQDFCNKYHSCIKCVAWYDTIYQCHCRFMIWYNVYRWL